MDNPHVVNVYIHDKDRSLPDPKDLAAKYDVDYEPSDEEEHDNDPKTSKNESFDEEYVAREISQQASINERVDKLVNKLDSKNREIERLCVLLEAVSVVPGADPGKFVDIIDGNGDEVADYRDTKIVSLAKKCRNLTVSLNKERGLNQSIKDKINTLQDDNGRLKRELDLVSSPAARAAATRARESKGSRGDAPSKDSAQLQKQVEDLRRKLTASQDETKKLSRALAKELGEGVSVEQAVDDGWRGRAQQIVMLKAKVKRLEAGQTSGGVGRTRGTRDVDAKAEEELQSMSAERQQAVEALTEDHQRLSEECGQLQHKLERQKARVRALESDSATHKQQLKVLVEKAESDDALIEALQKEVQSARSQLDDSRRKLREQAEAQSQPQMRTMRAADGAMACAVDTSSQALEAELNRMRRLCKQQAAQLETQETVIQKLRASAAKSSRV